VGVNCHVSRLTDLFSIDLSSRFIGGI